MTLCRHHFKFCWLDQGAAIINSRKGAGGGVEAFRKSIACVQTLFSSVKGRQDGEKWQIFFHSNCIR